MWREREMLTVSWFEEGCHESKRGWTMSRGGSRATDKEYDKERQEANNQLDIKDSRKSARVAVAVAVALLDQLGNPNSRVK